MKIKRYEQIVFKREDYDNDEEKLFKVVAEQLRILLNAGYIAVIQYDEPGLGIVVIEYEHNERFDAWGCANPVWITEEEEEQIIYEDEKND